MLLNTVKLAVVAFVLLCHPPTGIALGLIFLYYVLDAKEDQDGE